MWLFFLSSRRRHTIFVCDWSTDVCSSDLSAAITVVTMCVVTAQLDRQLALVALTICPPLFFLSRVYRPRMRRQSRRVKKLESTALAVVQEALGALRVVKAFGQEAHETARFVHPSREAMTELVGICLLPGADTCL